MKAFCSFGLVCVSAFLACEWIAAPALAAATLEKEGLTTPDLSAIRAKASVHGPFRNDPAQGIPKHAYSPFDDINKPPPRQPAPGRDYLEGRLVIKFRPQVVISKGSLATQGGAAAASIGKLTDSDSLNQTLQAQGIVSLEPVFPTTKPPVATASIPGAAAKPDLTRWYRAKCGTDVKTAVEQLSGQSGVEVAEPDYIRRLAGEMEQRTEDGGQKAEGGGLKTGRHTSAFANLPANSSDPLFDQSWHLAAAKIPDAWAYLESQGLPPGGSRDIVVAVIDTGVDYNHPDLAANMWTNSREIAGNGIDDDGNGFVDDVHGCSTVSNTGSHSGNPMDDHGHGTHVAGIIAAQGNNGIGGVGVAYNVQIMAIKAAQYSGVLAASDIAEGINYAVAQGADVINMSFGGYAKSQIEEDALAVAFGQCVLVAAAGNDGVVNESPPPIYWPSDVSRRLQLGPRRDGADAKSGCQGELPGWFLELRRHSEHHG